MVPRYLAKQLMEIDVPFDYEIKFLNENFEITMEPTRVFKVSLMLNLESNGEYYLKDVLIILGNDYPFRAPYVYLCDDNYHIEGCIPTEKGRLIIYEWNPALNISKLLVMIHCILCQGYPLS